MRRVLGLTANLTQASSKAISPAAPLQSPALVGAQMAYQNSIIAYRTSISKLAPAWAPLPTAPYPPAGDDSNFPRSGSPELYVNATQVTAAQLAEPQKIVYYQKLDADAVLPKLNWYFVIGAACLAGYFYVRQK